MQTREKQHSCDVSKLRQQGGVLVDTNPISRRTGAALGNEVAGSRTNHNTQTALAPVNLPNKSHHYIYLAGNTCAYTSCKCRVPASKINMQRPMRGRRRRSFLSGSGGGGRPHIGPEINAVQQEVGAGNPCRLNCPGRG